MNFALRWYQKNNTPIYRGPKQLIEAIQSIKHSQYIANDPHTPHVGGVRYFVEIHDFWGHEFRRTEEHLELLARVVPPGEAEVDYFNLVSGPGHTQDVFGL